MDPNALNNNQNGAGTPSSSANVQQDAARIVTPHVAAKRRERPPLRYTEDFETPSAVNLDVIGVVRSPYKVRLSFRH